MIKSLLALAIFIGSFATAEAQTYVNGGVAAPGTVIGWNYGYISHCIVVADSSTTWYYPYSTAGGYAFTNNPGLATFVGPACQSGNIVGIYVLSLNPFVWSHVATFPFQ